MPRTDDQNKTSNLSIYETEHFYSILLFSDTFEYTQISSSLDFRNDRRMSKMELAIGWIADSKHDHDTLSWFSSAPTTPGTQGFSPRVPKQTKHSQGCFLLVVTISVDKRERRSQYLGRHTLSRQNESTDIESIAKIMTVKFN